MKDINAAVDFFSKSLGIPDFPSPELVRAQDLNMTYRDKVVDAEWLTTQAYNGLTFVELVQPLSGQSMFHDYLNQYPAGGAQHFAYRLPVSHFEDVVGELQAKGYEILSEVDHPIAKMAFLILMKQLGQLPKSWGLPPKDGMLLNKWKKEIEWISSLKAALTSP